MAKIQVYEDGSRCLETSSGALISNTSLVDWFKTLVTDTDFERIAYLMQEWYSKEDASEILDRYKNNYKELYFK